MTTVPFITAVMPVYAGLPHCVAALRSVLRQTLAPSEVIVVDDGSPDESAAALHAEWDRQTAAGTVPAGTTFTVLTQANAGQSAARNAAVAHARGTFVAFIDQDDLWHPTHLERLAALAVTDPTIGWVYSDFDEIDGDGKLVTRSFIAYNRVPHPRTSLNDVVASDLMVVPSASLLRTEALREVGGFDARLQGYEDDDLFVRIFRAGWRCEFIPHSLTSFRVHGPGESSSASPSFQRSRIVFLENLRALLPDNPRMNRYWVRDVVCPRLFQTTLTEYCTALRVGDFRTAGTLAATAAAIAPAFDDRRTRRRIETWLLQRPRLMQRMLRIYEAVPWRPAINRALSLKVPGNRPGR